MTNKKYNYLIVGAGLFGSTFACCAMKVGKSCLVIDRRPNLGGNVYCENTEGINVHKYGPHIFHTSDKQVWDFVNRFVDFNRFTLNTLANYKGDIYNLPFNMNTFYGMWHTKKPKEVEAMIEKQRFKGIISNLEEQALSLVGRDIYEKLIKGYTEKQWGRPCKDLPSFIIRRLPVRYVYDNNYFNDLYQGIPIGGYNRLIEGLLEGADTKTNIDFFDGLHKNWRNIADKLVYTGKMDDFYEHKYGRLQYRSLNFENEILDEPNYQGAAIVNYTDSETPFTRIIEHKHFEYFGNEVYSIPKTVITREYPSKYVDGSEAYYPVNDAENNNLFAEYKKQADKETDVIFGGRLAEYRYYDMDGVIRSALDKWENIKSKL